jgi:hypothetical protein
MRVYFNVCCFSALIEFCSATPIIYISLCLIAQQAWGRDHGQEGIQKMEEMIVEQGYI